MSRAPTVRVVVDLARIRANVEQIRSRINVDLIAVVKADAYGLGARRVVNAIDDLVDEFATFSIDEGIHIDRPGIVLGPCSAESSVLAAHGLRPCVGTREDAQRYRDVPCVVNVDTGMQRFGCREEEVAELLAICGANEVMTHAVDRASAQTMSRVKSAHRVRVHAAASAQLDDPSCHLDAVRPGIALYRRALRVMTPLVAVRRCCGPLGYTRFDGTHVGVILAGYSHGLSPAPVLINGRPQHVVEVGMNSSYVSVDARDAVGEPVVLLGDDVHEDAMAGSLGIRPHAVLCRYAGMGEREYRETSLSV